ncbi:MAG: hypothetical protein SO468_10500 [Prevotella sp.]|nr:hypothetical protein [Prevotella sp.]
MKKYTLISTDKLCNLILAVLGVEGEYDGFINDGKLKQLCYIIKKDFDRIDFRKFAELRDLGIDGEIGKDNDELSGFIDVRFNCQENFLGQTLLEVPEDKIVALVKMLISERFVTQTDNIVGVKVLDKDSVIVDLKSDSLTGISLLDEDLRIIAMIGCFVNVYVLGNKMLRIKLTF